MESPLPGGGVEMIGADRYYETMAFKAIFEDPYWHADVENEVSFDSPWSIGEVVAESDMRANTMHENVVAEIMGAM
jgi:hypothetical protein